MVTCRIYEEWRVRMEPGQSAPPRDVEAHLAACATCRRSRTRYEGAIDAIRDQVERTSSTGPDMVAIRAGLAADHAADRLPARSRAGGRGLAVAAAAMAAVVLAALGGWFVLDREHPVFATHSPAATPSGDPSTPLVTDVRPGQWIQTEGAETRVSDSRVADLKVGPYTHLQVGAWDTIRTVLFLDEGRIDVSVRSLKADETFEIRTPLALVRVVGTRFRTLHRTGVETVVTCVEGEVKVETLAEVELARVRAGYEVRVTRDGVEGPRPVALDLDAVDRLARAPAPTPAMAPAPVVDRTPWGSPGAAPLLASSQVTPRPAPRADVAPAGPAGTAAEPGTVIEEARRNLDRGQAQEAIEAIRRALESGTAPEPRLLALLGDALRVAGRPEEARAAYERSATSDSAAVPEGVLVDLAQVLQQDLGRPREAERTWWQYLTLHPRGRHAAQALGGLAMLACDEGRSGECGAVRTRLLAEHPDAPEASRAFADAGREMLARRAAEDAWSWFAARRDDPVPALAETALAGMVQARALQGRPDDARTLANEHLRRFPGGAHAPEVRAFLTGSWNPSEHFPPRR